MNENFPQTQFQIIDILEEKYKINPFIITDIYFPVFMDNTNAENILQAILKIESETKNLEDAKLKITDFFALTILDDLFNNIENQKK